MSSSSTPRSCCRWEPVYCSAATSSGDDGDNPTEAIRAALAIAQRTLADEELRREAARLAADPAETREAEAVSAFIGDGFEDLPE